MKKIDFIMVILLPTFVFVSAIFFNLNINYLVSLILFFGIPCLYLSIRSPYKVRKVGTFSLAVSIPVAMIFELLTLGDRAWLVPHSVLSQRLLGIIPLEDFVWMFVATYIILMFYENFCTKEFTPKISHRIKILSTLLYGLTFVLSLLFLSTGRLLVIPYSYLLLCLLFWMIPISIFLFRYPKYLWDFSKVALFFLYLHFIYELMGLYMGYWVFPGIHYIGWISILGFNIPLEEFLFVIMFGGFAPCVYYEFFANQGIARFKDKR